MAHFDLYQSLGLSRQTSSVDLAAEIDARRAMTSAEDVGMRDQLSTARAVLGDETRRSLYDQRLDDPSAPEMDVASLRELAALDIGERSVPVGDAAPGKGAQFQQQAGATARQVQESFKQSNLLAIGVTAVVTAVVVGLAGWALGLFGGGDELKDAKNTTNEMLGKSNSDDLRSWVQDNSTYQDRDSVLSQLKLSGDGSFSGMDSLFGGSDLTAGEALAGDQLKMTTLGDIDEFYEMLDDEGYTRDEADSLVRVGVVDGNDSYKGSVLMLERDGDYQIVDVRVF
ncbi:hypothetical protein [Corynebacterium sp.]|uniref:hypothetical protein n=1 Tax=Corynebacterium sp. TaxID=1720 RepID=UPI003B3A8162